MATTSNTPIVQNPANPGVTTPTAASTAPQPIVGKNTGKESALSTWVGPYVTDMLGKGQAISGQPYQAYTGPLTAGPSDLQTQAFQGVANLAVPTAQMGAFTPQTFGTAQAAQHMNPYLQTALQPQLDELDRQQQLKRIDNASRLARAGAYGGSRQAVMESELDRAYLDKAANITGIGYLDAYNKAQQQFNTEQQRQMAAQNALNTYGLNALNRQAEAGKVQRAIETEGITADRKQFEEERAFPYKNITYQQSLLSGLPLETQSYSYAQPSALQNILTGIPGAKGLSQSLLGSGGISGLLGNVFGGDSLPGYTEGIIGGGFDTTADESLVPDYLTGGDYVGDDTVGMPSQWEEYA